MSWPSENTRPTRFSDYAAHGSKPASKLGQQAGVLHEVGPGDIGRDAVVAARNVATFGQNRTAIGDLLARTLGIFATYLLPTSLPNSSATAWRTWQCCTANAARGLYYAWEAITRCDGDDAQVNLLLNRAARWLDIDSYLPYQGRAVIRNKTARRIAVRIPAYVNRTKLRCLVNCRPVSLSVVGGYQIFDDLKPGDVVELRFPVRDTTITRTTNVGVDSRKETAYTIAMRANTVMDISPRDESPTSYPMYLRDHLRRNKAPTKTVQRFVPDRIAQW